MINKIVLASQIRVLYTGPVFWLTGFIVASQKRVGAHLTHATEYINVQRKHGETRINFEGCRDSSAKILVQYKVSITANL